MPDASNSESKELDGDEGDLEHREVEPKTKCAIWTNLLAFTLFTFVAIAHAYVNT